MGKNPRQYPDTMPSAESGRAMTRGEKEVAFTIDGKTFTRNHCYGIRRRYGAPAQDFARYSS
jgi:hypothetical protein